MDPSDTVYEILEKRLLEIKEYLGDDEVLYEGEGGEGIEQGKEDWRKGMQVKKDEDVEFKYYGDGGDAVADADAEVGVAGEGEEVAEVEVKKPTGDSRRREPTRQDKAADASVEQCPTFSETFQELFMDDDADRNEKESVIKQRLEEEAQKAKEMEPETNSGF